MDEDCPVPLEDYIAPPKPLKPPPPYKSREHMRKEKIREWGLQHREDFQKRTDYPCPNCKGTGLVNGEKCAVNWCNKGVAPRWVFEGLYMEMLREYRERLKVWSKRYAMHNNILRKLTPAEKIYLGLVNHKREPESE